MKTPDLCVACKGTKKLCGLHSCPLLNKIRAQHKQKKEIKEFVFGPSNEIFVGSYSYPDISVGPMVSTFQTPLSPKELYGMEYGKIIEERIKIVRGKKTSYAKKRIEDEMRDVSLSISPIDVEMNFSKKPVFDIKFSSVLEPMGASAPIKDYKLADNPKIPKKVDSVLDENLLAAEGMDELYNHGFDNYYLTKIMSIGVLGKKENKKIVPTRWSITATDDLLGKKLLEKIREYEPINEFFVFSNEFLENHFEILLMPGNFEFENFESWNPKSIWAAGAKEAVISEEYEGYFGRTRYADKQVGGYYASRIGILEYLNSIRRQARVVVFREIKEGYIVPVGVWEVRENVRNALKNKGKKFQTLSEALQDISTRLSSPMKRYLKHSRILLQKKLGDF
ncbi:MAG: Nre family DNA repair protein [Candidatus Micrarchaeia archaeon]